MKKLLILGIICLSSSIVFAQKTNRKDYYSAAASALCINGRVTECYGEWNVSTFQKSGFCVVTHTEIFKQNNGYSLSSFELRTEDNSGPGYGNNHLSCNAYTFKGNDYISVTYSEGNGASKSLSFVTTSEFGACSFKGVEIQSGSQDVTTWKDIPYGSSVNLKGGFVFVSHTSFVPK